MVEEGDEQVVLTLHAPTGRNGLRFDVRWLDASGRPLVAGRVTAYAVLVGGIRLLHATVKEGEARLGLPPDVQRVWLEIEEARSAEGSLPVPRVMFGPFEPSQEGSGVRLEASAGVRGRVTEPAGAGVTDDGSIAR